MRNGSASVGNFREEFHLINDTVQGAVIPESFRNTVLGTITPGFLDMCHRFGKICASFSL